MRAKSNRAATIIGVCVFAVLLLASCGTPNPLVGVPLESTGIVYGFWNGLWDGMTAVLAFIGNLFGGHYAVYQVHNNGLWYDFGYLLGLGAFSSGSSSTASSSKRRIVARRARVSYPVSAPVFTNQTVEVFQRPIEFKKEPLHKNCEGCDKPLSEDAAYCSYCGRPVGFTGETTVLNRD